MAAREILVYPDDRLRQPTTEVTKFDDELKALVQDMFDTLKVADGIGLAAPQIGVSKKVVIIHIEEKDENNELLEEHRLVLINPKFLEKHGTTEYKEGCLSIPTFYETVQRAERVKLQAQDENGETHVYDADGLLAICMQHEYDHLEGHLFIDHISSLKRERIVKGLKKMRKDQQS